MGPLVKSIKLGGPQMRACFFLEIWRLRVLGPEMRAISLFGNLEASGSWPSRFSCEGHGSVAVEQLPPRADATRKEAIAHQHGRDCHSLDARAAPWIDVFRSAASASEASLNHSTGHPSTDEVNVYFD